MKRAIVIATGMAALAVSVAVKAGPKIANEKFCAAVASFQSDVAQLNTLGPHSTVAELRAVKRRIDRDVDQMQTAASFMGTAKAKQFLDAMHRLDKDVNDVSDDATLQQARSKVDADVRTAQSAGSELATEAGCLQPAPQPTQ